MSSIIIHIRNICNFPSKSSKILPNDASSDITSSKPKKRVITSFDIWALGITIAISGQFTGFNGGLAAGFGSYAIISLVVGIAYTFLILCTSEITSGLPFAGGAYGLARVSLGFYVGFMIGFVEAIEYIICQAITNVGLGLMFCDLWNISYGYNPVITLIFYTITVIINIMGGSVFWDINAILGVISTLIIIMYFFGSLPYVNFDRYAPEVNIDDYYGNTNTNYFIGGGVAFMSAIRLAAWLFLGVEALGFAADEVDEPKKIIPRGSISCVITLFITGIMVLFVAASLPAGETSIANSSTPLSKGFSLMFNISELNALSFTIPATVAGMTIIYPYGKLLQAMGNSHLLPSPFTWTSSSSGTPYFSIIIGSFLGYLICLLCYWLPVAADYLLDITILLGFVTYISQCLGYIAMSTKFQSISREFHSPVGIYGAVFAIIVFALGIISVIAFQADYSSLIVCIIGGVILTIYYYTYAKQHQTFSPEESKIMFVAHVILFNRNGKKNRNGKGYNGSKSIKSGNNSSGKKVIQHMVTSKQAANDSSTGDSQGASSKGGNSTVVKWTQLTSLRKL